MFVIKVGMRSHFLLLIPISLLRASLTQAMNGALLDMEICMPLSLDLGVLMAS